MESVVNYPSRGKWGKSSWRGNTSGHIIVDLVEHFKPQLFVDACEGSGTSRDVCSDLGVDYIGLDLHRGHDFTSSSILANCNGKHGDIVFSHPPYSNMIQYSGGVWGNEMVEGDTSLMGPEEFIEFSQLMLMNQREATKEGGVYATLIGDMRKDGAFHSFQADFIKMMPKSELLANVIKIQNNSKSFFREYKGSFIPICHEYLIIWKKKKNNLFQVSWEIAADAQKIVKTTWRNVVRQSLINCGGKGSLSDIYRNVEKIAGERIAVNPHWKAKIRQVLQEQADYISKQRGIWEIAA